jgi:hypothetical protein
MTSSVELTGDVVTGATALGGLILVYLGGVVTSFASYDRAAQTSVKRKHQIRAWFAVAALILSMLSAAFALMGKWSG